MRPVATARNFTQGNLQQTSNPLDLAIKRQRLLPDPDARRHAPAYTRDGSFQVDAQGQLVTTNGFAVQPGITIPANAQSVTIAADGTVSARCCRRRSAPTQVGQLQLAIFVNPAGLEPRGQNLFAETAASGTPNAGTPGHRTASGMLAQGYVETSNVNVVEELVAMIQTQRAYEINSKAIQTSDQMLQRLGQL